MSINYEKHALEYKPKFVKTLLVGEAPPPSKKTYFYLPKKMNPDRDIKNYSSLPATIFYHYFETIPSNIDEYENLLFKLKNKGIFLIDIINEPLKIRDRSSKTGINEKNLEKLVSYIPKLRTKIKYFDIQIDDKDIVFLLPRLHYKKYLKNEFPDSHFYRWIDFRLKKKKNNLYHVF